MNRGVLLIAIIFAATLGDGFANSIRTLGAKPISRIEFHETPVGDALEFLRLKSEELDPAKQGVNFLITPEVDQSKAVTLRLHDVPFGVVLGYVMELADLQYKVDAHAVRVVPRAAGASPAATGSNAVMAAKTRRMILPQVEFEKAELGAVVDFLAEKSAELDPEKKGVNFILGTGVDPKKPVTLRLSNIPLANVLGYVADSAGVKVRADRWAIVFYNPAAKAE